MPIHIAIAEDNVFALEALKRKLVHYRDVQIKLIAPHGKYLVEHIADSPIDIVLMDIEMPLMDGIQATEVIKRAHPQIKVVVLTTFDDDDRIFAAIRSGASGYLLKEADAETIFRAIQEVLDGGAPMSPAIALKVLRMVRTQVPPVVTPTTDTVDFRLTKRELEILEQLKNGLTYQQIAANLFISFGTVRKHIDNIYQKLHVSNKVEALQKIRLRHLY